MKALVTSLHFAGLTGSEIVALEVLEELRHVNVDASVYGYAYSEGYVDYFNDSGIHVLEVTPCLWDYDLVWSQHGMWCRLLAELPFPEQSDALLPLITPVSLSPYEEVERVPVAPARSLGLTCWVNSEETASVERTRLGDVCPVHVFSNAAPRSFHRKCEAPASRQASGLLGESRRMLIVSNHPPAELCDAVELLRHASDVEDLPVQVDWAGQDGDYRRVNPEMLLRYDAVVTIGKTVQYCICLGVPVYVYDLHGGPGWLNEDVYEQAKYYNFSSRPWPPKSCRQIAAELSRPPLGPGVNLGLQMARDTRDRFDLTSHLEGLLSRARDREARLESQNGYLQSSIDSPDFSLMLSEIGRLHAYIQRLQPLAIRDMANFSARKLVETKQALRCAMHE